ncbi:MAG: hypothetical protein J6B75_05370 [Ruminococcus sp.]|nr:hypothetical protein [Ruminococcus sp.]
MKTVRIIAAAAALAALMSMAACGDKKNNSSSSGENSIITYSNNTTEAPTAAPTEEIKAAEDGPRLFIKDTTAAPGEVAEVTVAVENAEAKWNMCGFHITYPNVLKPEMADAEERMVERELGEASEYNNGSVAMEWQENLPEELTSNNLGSIFFAEMFEKDHGLDGDVVTFFLKIPEDAKSGTEYPVNFFYLDGDLFENVAKDKAMEKYVFENWKGGKITVK